VRIGEAIIQDATKITQAWTKHQERRIRSWGRATWRPPRKKTDTIKDVAWRHLPAAYAKAAGRVGMAAPRQVFYAARPLMLADLPDLPDHKLSSVYFTQTLLPDYLAAHPEQTAGWDLLWDDRGHFSEPHTGTAIGLGTWSVREYLRKGQGRMADDLEVDPIETAYPTLGPRHRFANVLLIEKEGFQEIFNQVQLAQRFDLAIMSSKGMNTTAARTLVERLPEVRFLVLHDLDKSGFSILGTLTRSTRRYRFRRRADIVDLGIRLADVDAEALESEPVQYTKDPEENLRANGATAAEIAFLTGAGGRRVELNAFDSDHLIAWLERTLTAHGVAKLIPDGPTLAAAYRRALLTHQVNKGLVNLHAEARTLADSATIPTTLANQIAARLKDSPAIAWDAAVADIAEEHDEAPS
jgi:hypothetical protein